MVESAMLKDFKEFALKGNVLDMAVGIVIGAAFTAVVNSLVADVITPPLALIQPDAKTFDDFNLALGGGTVIKLGSFINHVIQFTIVAFAIFLVVRAVNRLRQPAPVVPTRECPYCITAISPKATRCPHCTSELPSA